MTDVFISYSRKDKVFARRLFEQLEQNQLEGWADWEGITGGEDWWRKICAAIDAANTFVIIITPDALTSKYCNLEIEHARRNNKRIIPILRREPDIKLLAGEWYGKDWENTARENYEQLGTRQYILFRKKLGNECFYDDNTHEVTNPDCDSPQTDADNFETAFQTLLEAAHQDPEYVRQHTRLLVRAKEWEAKTGSQLQGDELTVAEAWLAGSEGKNPVPTLLHERYIAASRQSAKRRQQLTIGGLSIGILVTAALAIFGLVQARTAERRAEEAQSTSWAIAARDVYERDGDPFTGLALALEANRIPAPSFLAQRVLGDIAYNSGVRIRFKGHSSSVNSVVFSPDGDTVLSGGARDELILWDVASGNEIRRFKGQNQNVNNMRFSPDGDTVLSGGRDGELILWDVATGNEIRRFGGHSASVNSVAFSPDGDAVLSGGEDREVILWDVATGNEIRRFEGHDDRVSSVAFSPDGDAVLSGGEDSEVILWDVATGNEIRRFESHSASVYSVAFSPNGYTVLSGGEDGELILWDVASGNQIRRLEGHRSDVRSLAFSPDGDAVLSASGKFIHLIDDKFEVILWDVATGNEIRRFEGHSRGVYSVAFSPNGDTVLSGGRDGEVILWDVAGGNQIRRFEGHSDRVSRVAFSPDGDTVLSGAGEGELILWNVASGNEIRRFEGHRSSVYSVAFSPDGDTVLSGAGDGELILWDVASGNEIRRFEGHRSSVESLAFSPNGDTVLSGGRDGELILWRIHTLEELLAWTRENRVVTELTCPQRVTYDVQPLC